MKHAIAVAAVIALGAPIPAPASYSEHEGVTLFTERPCTEAIAVIDDPGKDIPSLARMGAAWGWLLGYDTARGGLHSEGKTTLQRLRIACAAEPTATALEILERF